MPDGVRRRRVRVDVTDDRGRPAPVRGLAAWLTRVAPSAAHGSVTVALVTDARIQALNKRYRGKDYATDVLSFPADRGPAMAALRDTRAARRFQGPADDSLGDIVIARGVARRQARAARHTELTELKILALHGLLHLLGYDHERDNGTMQNAERRLRRKGGLREGLIERTRKK